MAELLNRLREKLSHFTQQMTMAQKITMILVVAVTFGLIVILVRWAAQPDYAVLFTDLNASDAQHIVEELQASKTPYKLENNGKSVLVPRKEVYEWRMKFAAQEIPTSGGIGYEIFDKKDIGVSEFVQQVNFRRALEGELARTIQSMAEIEKVRVHIVFPKERLFKEDQKQPTASIFLVLRGGSRPRENQIQGIARLVANSVEGLTPENVTIVDSNGTVLSKKYADDSMAGLSDTQHDMQRRAESYLEEKAQSMLDKVLGVGNAIVRLRAELDFKRIERTSEQYDPDNAVVLSEETEEESLTDSTGAPSNKLERTVTNYQLTKSIEHVINNIGDIKRLTVSVLVNGTYRTEVNADSQQVQVYVPRDADEMARLAALVQNAVGYDETRGDQLEIDSIEFNNPLPDQEIDFFQNFLDSNWFKIAERVATILGIVLLFFIFKSHLKKAKGAILNMGQIGGNRHSMLALADGTDLGKRIPSLESEIPQTSIVETRRLQQITNFIEEKPSIAARLIRYWLMEG